jgi:very-short-patch-repair endonuclease
VSLYTDDGCFLARVDLFYRRQKLAIEYDGATHRDSLVEDNRRQNAVLAAGYQMRRFTSADVLGRPELVITQVRAALAA